MNVLVVTTPSPGHVNPLRPLLQALIAGGDRVMVAAAASAAPTVQGMGADFCPCGIEEMDWFERLRARTRGNPGDGLPPERISHYFIPRLFGEIATDDMIDDVLACGRRFEPDVVLFETYAFAGPLASDLLGIPGINHSIGPLLAPGVMELVNDAVSPLWRHFDRDVPGYAGVYRELTIQICPPSLEALQVPEGACVQLRPAPLPQRVREQGARPLVYVTLGTTFNANFHIFRAVLDGLAAELLDVVVTVGADQDPDRVAPVPANAKVERFIPQATLLPTCSAVVHHGGAGTMFGSLAHGLPQVVIPQGADNFINAEMLERAGMAQVLRPGEVTPDHVRDAVRRILREPSYALAGGQAAAEIAAMKSPEDVAGDLRERYAQR